MRRALLIGALAVGLCSVARAEAPDCLMAVEWRDGIVTVNWKCVDRYAANGDLHALLMKRARAGEATAEEVQGWIPARAVRDGTAVSVE